MRNLKFLGVSFLLAMTAATSGVAQNPIIQTKYTADPTPMVYCRSKCAEGNTET